MSGAIAASALIENGEQLAPIALERAREAEASARRVEREVESWARAFVVANAEGNNG